jgi:hypothetical protein
LDRRSFVTLGSLSLATPVADAALGSPAPRASIKAVAFDAFAIFDHPTFWNNRQNAAAEELSVRADATGTTLTQLVSFLHAD